MGHAMSGEQGRASLRQLGTHLFRVSGRTRGAARANPDAPRELSSETIAHTSESLKSVPHKEQIALTLAGNSTARDVEPVAPARVHS